jgi:hypothetical protein
MVPRAGLRKRTYPFSLASPTSEEDLDKYVQNAPSSLLTSKQIIILGGLAMLGHGLGIVADVATGYAPAVETNLSRISSLALENIAPLLRAKPLSELIIGHYLAIFFIPLGLFGIWQVYQGMNPQHNRPAALFLLTGAFGLIYAAFYHGTLGFVAGALQAQEGMATGVGSEMVDFFNLLSEPLGKVLLLVDVSVSLLFAAIVWLRRTSFPRWMAVCNPLTIQLILLIFVWLFPHPLSQLLWLTIFNLSLVLWYLTTTITLLVRHPDGMHASKNVEVMND